MTLRSHLVVLVLVALLPVVLFSLVVVVMLATQERAATDVGLQAMTRSVAASVDSLLRDSVTSLGTLAAAEHLEHGDVPAFYRMCLRMLPSHPGWSGVALVDASGRAAFSTHRPLGEPLPDAGDRDHIRRALATGRPFVSGHVVGTVTGSRPSSSSAWRDISVGRNVPCFVRQVSAIVEARPSRRTRSSSSLSSAASDGWIREIGVASSSSRV